MATDWENCEGDVGKAISELLPEDIAEFVFSSLGDVSKFYTLYAKTFGFSIRVRDSKQPNNLARMKRWVCSAEGLRDEIHNNREDRTYQPRRKTRFQCEAGIRVKFFPATNSWRIVKFQNIHSHPLVPAPSTHYLRSHRVITTTDMAQIDALRFVGVRSCQIMQYFCNQSGGPANVGFINRDLENYVSMTRANQFRNRDFHKTIGYLTSKQHTDPGFFFRYTLSTENAQWENIFWCDTISKIDFHRFGDVMTFDATHSTNTYGKPMVLFIGINNHRQTCIFGCALLEHETSDSYKWLLRVLKEAMLGQIPKSVITDGAVAIKNAISEVYGDDCCHRLCSWHLTRSIKGNVGDPKFCGRFNKCMYTNCAVEFEMLWAKLVSDYGLETKVWAINLYANKNSWACAYLVDKFFAGQHANSRSESVNFTVKNQVHRKNNLYEMFRHFETVLEQQREKERKAQHDTCYTTAVLTTPLVQIEEQAAGIYTEAAFKEFRKQLVAVGSYVVSQIEQQSRYIFQYSVCRYTNVEKKHAVLYDYGRSFMTCSCKMFEREGMLCRHILSVFKHLHFTQLPRECFLRRWTRVAKDDAEYGSRLTVPEDDLRIFRQASLNSIVLEVVTLGSQNQENFNDARTTITDIIGRLKLRNQNNSNDVQQPVTSNVDVQYAENITETGKLRKRKRTVNCSKCGQEGHNRATCTFVEAEPSHVETSLSGSLSSSQESGASSYSNCNSAQSCSPVEGDAN